MYKKYTFIEAFKFYSYDFYHLYLLLDWISPHDCLKVHSWQLVFPLCLKNTATTNVKKRNLNKFENGYVMLMMLHCVQCLCCVNFFGTNTPSSVSIRLYTNFKQSC